ncbi:hypothetical protein [Mesotoga sp. H07.pep.5.3]|uniref:hypothetical protein n=1 Tax=Mesotoga sp. H07.pep.5.3 TaxID=1421003 RepID=UPI000C18FAA3|nr:hypothetical protein [Mesotoga sp. H07.pep.5.3]
MDRNTFAEGLAVLMMAFPGFTLDRPAAELWYKMLSDISDTAFSAAVHRLVMTTHRAPTIAAIRKAALDETKNSLTAEDAWQIVIEDVHKYGIYKEQFYDDPRLENAKRTIGWQELCDMTGESRRVVRAQFIRAYESYDFKEDDKALNGKKEEVNKELLSKLFGGVLPGERAAEGAVER